MREWRNKKANQRAYDENRKLLKEEQQQKQQEMTKF